MFYVIEVILFQIFIKVEWTFINYIHLNLKIIKKDLSEDQFKKFDLDEKEALQALVLINQNVDKKI